MKLVIISGRSGSGKSSALHALEDEGYYCVDNIPVSILDQLPAALKSTHSTTPAMAASIDVRNVPGAIKNFPALLVKLRNQGIDCKVIFLDADSNTLINRYSATRRKHPLTNEHSSLAEAIQHEKLLLAPVQSEAELKIDTSTLSIHQIRDRIIRECVGDNCRASSIRLLFQSFGFKHGIPMYADFIFDVRCLPNPFWIESLRELTGKDEAVQKFLAADVDVRTMLEDIAVFVEKWLPRFEVGQRPYMTIALGCTGGQHRSVYLAEMLKQQLSSKISGIQIRHRELPEKQAAEYVHPQ